MLICLSGGNKADNRFGFGVDDHNDSMPDQSKCLITDFSIIKSVVNHSDDISLEHGRDVNKVNAVFLDVAQPLRLVPFESHK